MLFYVFLLFMFLPNMVFLLISWEGNTKPDTKFGIWFAIVSCLTFENKEEPIDIDSLTPEQMKEMLKKMMGKQ